MTPIQTVTRFLIKREEIPAWLHRFHWEFKGHKNNTKQDFISRHNLMQIIVNNKMKQSARLSKNGAEYCYYSPLKNTWHFFSRTLLL